MAYAEQEEKKYVCVDEVIDRLYDNEFAMHCPLDEVSDVIYNTPTADVAEVVRCKDCDYYIKSKQFGKDWCNKHAMNVRQDAFCSDGERRKDNEL